MFAHPVGGDETVRPDPTDLDPIDGETAAEYLRRALPVGGEALEPVFGEGGGDAFEDLWDHALLDVGRPSKACPRENGEFDAFVSLLRAGLESSRDPGDTVRRARIHNLLGSALLTGARTKGTGTLDEADGEFAAAYALADADGDDRGRAAAVACRGLVALADGRYEDALSLFTGVRLLEEAVGRPRGVAVLDLLAGRTLINLGRFDHALEHLDSALEFFAAPDDGGRTDEVNLARVRRERGRVLVAKRRWTEARRELDLALTGFAARGLAHQSAQVREVLAGHAQLTGAQDWKSHLVEAERLYRQALEISAADPAVKPRRLATAHLNLGVLTRDQGKLDEAEPLLLRALDLARTSLRAQDPAGFVYFLNEPAKLYAASGRWSDAIRLWEEALEILSHLEIPHEIYHAQILNDTADALLARGDRDRAEALYVQALEKRERILGDGARVMQHARVQWSVLGEGARVAWNGIASFAVLMKGSEVSYQGIQMTVLGRDAWLASEVTISGRGFGCGGATQTVLFAGTPATAIQSWSATSITVLVPEGATTGDVTVKYGGNPASDGVNFTALAITFPIASFKRSRSPFTCNSPSSRSRSSVLGIESGTKATTPSGIRTSLPGLRLVKSDAFMPPPYRLTLACRLRGAYRPGRVDSAVRDGLCPNLSLVC